MGSSRLAVLAVELADPVLVDELDREVAVVDPGRAERRLHRRAQLGRDVEQVDGQLGVCALRVLAVGGDDPLDELVADDVLAAEADEGDVVDRGEDLADDHQPGALVARQVDLGDVAGDHHLRPEAEPGQEHLHLLRARVLGLVEDHERVVERPAPHERQRRDLDHAAVEVGEDLLGVEHVVERVEQRAQVRVDLGLDVAGQEAEPLAGLDRRPGEDDPADLAGLERGDRASRPRGRSCRCRPGRSRR